MTITNRLRKLEGQSGSQMSAASWVLVDKLEELISLARQSGNTAHCARETSLVNAARAFARDDEESAVSCLIKHMLPQSDDGQVSALLSEHFGARQGHIGTIAKPMHDATSGGWKMSKLGPRLARLAQGTSPEDVLIFKTVVCDNDGSCEFLSGFMLTPGFSIDLCRDDLESLADFEQRILGRIDEQKSQYSDLAKQEFLDAIVV